MRLFLDDFINTQQPLGQARVSEVLNSAKLNKDRLKNIADRLINGVQTGAISLPRIGKFDILDSGQIRAALADLDISYDKVFRSANEVSLLLDSLLGVLSADLKNLEEELSNLEKSVENYAFLLSENGSYDYAYLEPFNDERGFDFSLPVVPDRGNRDFEIKDYAHVDYDSGNLVISGDDMRVWPISSTSLVGTNVSTLISASSLNSMSNMIKATSGNGWKVSVYAPTIMRGNMEGFRESGVAIKSDDVLDGTDLSGMKFVIEFLLNDAQPCDTIKIEPMSDWDFTLSEVLLYPSMNDDTAYYSPLDGPVTVDRTKLISFPTQTVAKFRLYVRQAIYKRGFDRPLDVEARNKKVFDELVAKNVVPEQLSRKNPILPQAGVTSSYGWWDQRMLLWLGDYKDPSKQGSPYSVSIPKTDFRKNWGAFSQRSQKLERRAFSEAREGWNANDWTTRIVQDVIAAIGNSEGVWSSVLNTSKQVKGSWTPTRSSIRPDRLNVPAKTEVSVEPITAKTSGQGFANTPLPYQYKLGIKNVSIGTVHPNDRAVFVSKQLEAPGEIGQVRIKSSESNVSLANMGRDTPRLTSIEYSVSNITNPTQEKDWIPILPIGSETIIGEKLIPDVTGLCKLRFRAKIDAPFKVYVNGKSIIAEDKEPNTVSRLKIEDVIRKDSGNRYIDAVKMPLSIFSASDSITVDYVPAADYTVLSFANANTDGKPPLVSSYDDDGAGEGFSDSGGQLVIDLLHNPFVDYAQVEDATYNPVYGLSGYAPITVRLNDGSTAYNLTNYKGGSQTALDSDSSNFQFIHTGSTLMFNKLITEPFRVYYQFQPSDVRVRIVLRNNYHSYVSPSVDFFQLKAKTKKADAKRGL